MEAIIYIILITNTMLKIVYNQNATFKIIQWSITAILLLMKLLMLCVIVSGRMKFTILDPWQFIDLIIISFLVHQTLIDHFDLAQHVIGKK